MAFGLCIAVVVLTILAMASLLEGGVWNVMGVVCILAILCFLYLAFQEDQNKQTRR